MNQQIEKFKAVSKHLGIEPRHISSATGISMNRVKALESGQREPSDLELRAIAAYLVARMQIAGIVSVEEIPELSK